MLSIKPVIAVKDGSVDEGGQGPNPQQGAAVHRRPVQARARGRACRAPCRADVGVPRAPPAARAQSRCRRGPDRSGDRCAHRPTRHRHRVDRRGLITQTCLQWADGTTRRQSERRTPGRRRGHGRPWRARHVARPTCRPHPRPLPPHSRQRARRARCDAGSAHRHRGIRSFDGRSLFTTWCYRVTTNAALDEVRRRQRRPTPADVAPSRQGPSPHLTTALPTCSTSARTRGDPARVPGGRGTARSRRPRLRGDRSCAGSAGRHRSLTDRARRAALADKLGNRDGAIERRTHRTPANSPSIPSPTTSTSC